MDTKSFSFKEIKETADAIDILDKEKIESLIFDLKNDSRKNVINLSLSLEKKLHARFMEIERVKKLYSFDAVFGSLVAGVDEVGRGPLAGPITAAAVILDTSNMDDIILGINDSKKLSSKKREELSAIIKEKAIAYSIASLDNDEIDEKGIGFCNNMVFINAAAGLKPHPDFVLSDGYPIRGFYIRNKGIVKGDTKSAAIAAASIIAKVYRDNLMKKYSEMYPYYGFENNVGYGSNEHIEAIKKYGPCRIHRRCFLNNII